MGKKTPRTDPKTPQKKARTVSSVASVSEMSGFSSGGSGTRTHGDDDKLYIAIMKYSSDGSLYDDPFEQGPIYVMQTKTNANHSPLFKLKTVLGLQWKQENSQDTISPDAEVGARLGLVQAMLGQPPAARSRSRTSSRNKGRRDSRSRSRNKKKSRSKSRNRSRIETSMIPYNHIFIQQKHICAC